MREVSTEKAYSIIMDKEHDSLFLDHPFGLPYASRSVQMLRFTKLAMEADIETIDALESIGRSSHDLVHLSGVHKFKYSPCKADELRFFWGTQWEQLQYVPHVREYIESVCEASGYRAGRARRAVGLFDLSGPRSPNALWRTREWYEARKAALHRLPVEPITQFYPYLPSDYTSEHRLLSCVHDLVPKSMRDDMRADVCQDILVDILSGALTIENIRDSLPTYVRRFFKQNATWGAVSLDAPIFGRSGKRTLADVLSSDR